MLSFYLNFISGGGDTENTLSTEDRNLHQVDLYSLLVDLMLNCYGLLAVFSKLQTTA